MAEAPPVFSPALELPTSPEPVTAVPSADFLAAQTTLQNGGPAADIAIDRAAGELEAMIKPPSAMMGGDPTGEAASRLASELADASAQVGTVDPNAGVESTPVVSQAKSAKLNLRKFFLASLLVVSGGVAPLMAGRELMQKEAILPFRQELLSQSCAIASQNTQTIQNLNIETSLAAVNPIGQFFQDPSKNAQREVKLDAATKAQAALNSACSDHQAQFTIALAAVTSARSMMATTTYAWLVAALATAGISIKSILDAALDSAKGDHTKMAALVNDTSAPEPVDVPFTPATPGNPTNSPTPFSLGPRRSRGGRRTYRKRKAAKKTRSKSRR